jgi:hypothetical protein
VLLTSKDVLPLKVSMVVKKIPALPLLKPAAVSGGGILSSLLFFSQELKRSIPNESQMTALRVAFMILNFCNLVCTGYNILFLFALSAW